MTQSLKQSLLVALTAIAWLSGAGIAAAADGPGVQALRDRTIAYVVTDEYWALHQTPNAKEECPQGLNEWGPREQFKALFPADGTKRTLKETQLFREGQIWNPAKGEDQFPYREASGKISYGVNLDGKVGPEDFTSPDGEKGVDNQLFRAIGCNDNFRAPTGILYALVNGYTRIYDFNRVIIELTNVDSLVDDPEVDVTILRGRDKLLTDGTGDKIIPGGTQRLETRWSKKHVKHLKGKIVGGVLTTAPADIRLLHGHYQPGEDVFSAAQFRLRLTPDNADGVLAGYADIENWYYHLNMAWASVYQSYGRLASQSLYKKLYQLADGNPDPKTGEMTAISAALAMKFTQVFIQRSSKVASITDPQGRSPQNAAGR